MSQQKFVSSRDINVGTVLGHSVFFKKGIPTEAPREIHSILVERGILPVDEAGEIIIEEVDKLAVGPGQALRLAPDDAEQRTAAIVEAMKLIVKRNDAKDFAGGTPSAQAVSDMVGWRTDQKECRQVWEKNRAVLLGRTKAE